MSLKYCCKWHLFQILLFLVKSEHYRCRTLPSDLGSSAKQITLLPSLRLCKCFTLSRNSSTPHQEVLRSNSWPTHLQASQRRGSSQAKETLQHKPSLPQGSCTRWPQGAATLASLPTNLTALLFSVLGRILPECFM